MSLIHHVCLYGHQTYTLTHHSSSVALHKLNDAGGVLVPQVDVSAVTAADHELTARPVEVHPLHCEKEVREDRNSLQSCR